MKRTSAPGHSSGHYTDGNPATSTPPTYLIAEDREMHQEELVNAILCAGLTLDDTGVNKAQLAAAIKALARLGGEALPLVMVTPASAAYITDTVTPGRTLGSNDGTKFLAASPGDVAECILPLKMPYGVTMNSFSLYGDSNSASDEVTADLVAVDINGVEDVLSSLSLTNGTYVDTLSITTRVTHPDYFYYVRVLAKPHAMSAPEDAIFYRAVVFIS